MILFYKIPGKLSYFSYIYIYQNYSELKLYPFFFPSSSTINILITNNTDPNAFQKQH